MFDKDGCFHEDHSDCAPDEELYETPTISRYFNMDDLCIDHREEAMIALAELQDQEAEELRQKVVDDHKDIDF